MMLDKFLNIIVYEGLDAILKPFCDIGRDRQIHDSILFALVKADMSGKYDFRGYIRNLTGLESLEKVSEKKFKKKIKSKVKNSLKKKSVKEIIRNIKKDLKSEIYFIVLDKLLETQPKDVFYMVFGTPFSNNQQKEIIDLIWKAFHTKVLDIITRKDLLLRLYQQETPPENIKQIIKYKIDKDANSHITKKERDVFKKVWDSLIDLERAAEKLWENAERDNLNNFIEIFIETKNLINNSGIFLNSKYRNMIADLFNVFNVYTDGKKLLIRNKSFVFVISRSGRDVLYNFNTNDEFIQTEKIKRLIEHRIERNSVLRENYIKTLNSLMEEFHQYIIDPLDFEETEEIAV